MAATRLGQSAAYDRVASLVEAGLLERLELLRGAPTLIRATRSGLRCAGLGIAPAVVSPGSVDHWLRSASVALDLEARHGSHRVLTARELIFAERHEGRPIASAKLGELPNGAPRLHRPDLVVLPPAHPLVKDAPLHTYGQGTTTLAGASDAVAGATARGIAAARTSAGSSGREAEQLPVVFEVELTPKSPKTLREIVRGWRRASWVEGVRYLCEPGQTRRAVERAVERLHAGDRIEIEGISR